jgi:uncharacterized OsmC-like protein
VCRHRSRGGEGEEWPGDEWEDAPENRMSGRRWHVRFLRLWNCGQNIAARRAGHDAHSTNFAASRKGTMHAATIVHRMRVDGCASLVAAQTQRRNGLMAEVNGIDVDELRSFIRAVGGDRGRADRDPVVVARWVGSDQSEVTMADGGPSVRIGGSDAPSAMRMLLMSLAACDVDLIANRAALMGVELEDLSVEARGHFNVARYLGLEAAEGPGYARVAYTVRVKPRNATADQLAELKAACRDASPVGDTLQRNVDVTFKFEVA